MPASCSSRREPAISSTEDEGAASPRKRGRLGRRFRLWLRRFADPTTGDLLLGALLLGIGVAAAAAVFFSFRIGACVLSALLTVLAVLRMLPGSIGELFAVRAGRLWDVIMMLALAAGIGGLAFLVPSGV